MILNVCFFGSYIKCLLFFIIGMYWSTCLTYIVAEVTHCKQADIDFRGHEEICAESGGVMDYEEDRSRPKRWFEKISYQSSIWSIILIKLIFYAEIGHKITYNCINMILVGRMKLVLLEYSCHVCIEFVIKHLFTTHFYAKLNVNVFCRIIYFKVEYDWALCIHLNIKIFLYI